MDPSHLNLFFAFATPDGHASFPAGSIASIADVPGEDSTSQVVVGKNAVPSTELASVLTTRLNALIKMGTAG